MSEPVTFASPRSSIQKRVFPIFITIFVDLLGFAMFLPDLQIRLKTFLAEGTMLGLGMAVYSIAQLMTSPYLGKLSDTVGRRKVLLITTFLSICAYVLYAHAVSLPIILASRILLGIAAGNVGVAFAYVSDVTEPEERARGMGFLGMAFGLGFVLGPGLGVLLLHLGNDSPLVLGYAGAGLCVINWLYIFFGLPEAAPHVGPKPSLRRNFSIAFGNRELAALLLMFFAVNFGFTHLETTFFVLLSDSRSIFHLDPLTAKKTGGIILVVVGLVLAFTQGFLVQKLNPVLGEVKMVKIGYWCMCLAFLLVPWAPLWAPALGVVGILGMSSGIANPSVQSIISRKAPSNLQGGIFGITQALGAVARCVGPISGNTLIKMAPWGPYAAGSCIIGIAAVLSMRLKPLPLAVPLAESEAGEVGAVVLTD
ncbi:MAG: MFS transporter [Armatimonadetes bacterium]|nr:MFS transporter [Armatimonadota bacterium]